MKDDGVLYYQDENGYAGDFIYDHAEGDKIEWKEGKGPKCVPLGDVRAAMLSGREQVDFLLEDRRRIRAELSDGCQALDFYVGFYLKTEDERMCAGRDFVHSRMGGRCEIDRFRSLEPRLRR